MASNYCYQILLLPHACLRRLHTQTDTHIYISLIGSGGYRSFFGSLGREFDAGRQTARVWEVAFGAAIGVASRLLVCPRAPSTRARCTRGGSPTWRTSPYQSLKPNFSCQSAPRPMARCRLKSVKEAKRPRSVSGSATIIVSICVSPHGSKRPVETFRRGGPGPQGI